MTQTDQYEVIVVGGGPAGLTTALYTTRLGHDTAMINRGGGRAAMMQETHNVIGITETVSGNEFLQTAIEQIREYGASYFQESVMAVTRRDADDAGFLVETRDRTLSTKAVVFATGFSDLKPDPPLPRTGRGLHYCLHCDAYMFIDESVYVMGHGESAAQVAMIMLNFTDSVDLLLDGDDPSWDDETARQLRAHPIEVVEEEITGMYKEESDPAWLAGFEFSDGVTRDYRGGFAMYGSSYHNELPRELGVDLNDDGSVAVDDHGETNVERVYAVGDLTKGHNQIPVAMGDGARTGIAIHYELRTYPRTLDELEADGAVSETDVPAVSETLRQQGSDSATSDD